MPLGGSTFTPEFPLRENFAYFKSKFIRHPSCRRYKRGLLTRDFLRAVREQLGVPSKLYCT